MVFRDLSQPIRMVIRAGGVNAFGAFAITGSGALAAWVLSRPRSTAA